MAGRVGARLVKQKQETDMKTRSLAPIAVAGFMVSTLVVPAYAQQDKSVFELGAAEAKQSSEDFKPAPAVKKRGAAFFVPGPGQM